MNNKHYVVRTKMADALIAAATEPRPYRNKATRQLIRRVLTNDAKGIGVKFNSANKKGNKMAAESAVMKGAA